MKWLRSHKVNLAGTITVIRGGVPRTKSARAATSGRLRLVRGRLRETRGEIPDLGGEPDATGQRLCGVDKLGCELHAAVASQIHELHSVGLRFFNIYGPRQDPHSPYSGVISIFCPSWRILGRGTD